jgi:hypothetical protein
MSTPHFRATGWYCDALPSGAFVRLIRDSHLETQHGTVPLPDGQNVLFVTLHPNGVTFAGIGHADDQCWEWDGSKWDSHGNAFGPYAVIYDREGTLWVVRRDPPVGYRYVDEQNVLVTAEQTYAHQTLKVWGYTSLFGENLIIGHGGKGEYVYQNGDEVPGEDPLIAILGSTTYLLMPGQCRHIRARWQGTRISLAFVREDIDSAVTWFTSLDEITQHAVITHKSVTPTPIPVPPTPEPLPVPDIPDQTAVIVAVRAKYPTPLGDSHAACLLEIARAIGLGAGLLKKDTGTNILLPDGVRVAQDIIVFPNGDGYDCLGSGETLAVPQWGGPVEGSPFPASRYHAVSSVPAPEPPPTPTPEPFPPPPVDADLLRRVTELENRVLKLEKAGFIAVYKP